jgi:hypothetical protein
VGAGEVGVEDESCEGVLGGGGGGLGEVGYN